MSPRAARRGSFAFFLLGPGLEAGVGPWVLTRWRGGDGALDTPLAGVVGLALLLAGLAVLVDAFVRIARDGRGTPTPAAPTDTLVVTGIYRHVRHPMYVATAAAIVGQGLLLARPILLVAAAAYVLALGFLARFVEEPLLAKRFGADFEAYRRAVPGWRPRLRPWSPATTR